MVTEQLGRRRGGRRYVDAGDRGGLIDPDRQRTDRRWLTAFGRRLGREVRLDERALQHLDGVGLPDQALGLIGAVRWFHAPQVHPDAVGLGRFDGGDHVLVPGHQDRVGDRPVPGQRLHVGTDLGVYAFLLAAGVQVAEPQLDQRHLGDDPLIEGRHPVPGRVVPVDPQQLAPDLIIGLLDQRLDQLVRVDPVLAPGRGTEQQLAGRRVDIPDIHHDGVSGQQRERHF